MLASARSVGSSTSSSLTFVLRNQFIASSRVFSCSGVKELLGTVTPDRFESANRVGSSTHSGLGVLLRSQFKAFSNISGRLAREAFDFGKGIPAIVARLCRVGSSTSFKALLLFRIHFKVSSKAFCWTGVA